MYHGGNRDNRFTLIVNDDRRLIANNWNAKYFTKTPPVPIHSNKPNNDNNSKISSSARDDARNENALCSILTIVLNVCYLQSKTTIWYLCVWTVVLPFVPIPINFIRIMCRGLLSSWANHLYTCCCWITTVLHRFAGMKLSKWRLWFNFIFYIHSSKMSSIMQRNFDFKHMRQLAGLIASNKIGITMPEIICGKFAILTHSLLQNREKK